jgi:hypothetical protein
LAGSSPASPPPGAATGTLSSMPSPKSNSQAHNYGYGSRYGYYDDLDLAGMCFDPSGERMYVVGAGNGFHSSFRGDVWMSLVQGQLLSGMWTFLHNHGITYYVCVFFLKWGLSFLQLQSNPS